MTISSTQNKTVFLGNGAQTMFNFPWVGDQSGDISVTYTDPSGIATLLTAPLYSIVLNPAAPGQIWGIGGAVIYPLTGSPIPNGSSLTVLRSLPLVQAVSLSNQGPLFPTSVEQGLDILEMQIQQVGEFNSRALTVPASDPNPPLPVPPIAQRANQLFGFDSSGQPIAAQPSSALVSSVMQPVVAAATLATAQELLFGFISVSAATTYYVATTGSDSNPGTLTQPWLTIQHAIDTVTSGSFIQNAYITIQVQPGTYTQQLVTKNFVGAYAREGTADSTGILLRGSPSNPALTVLTSNTGGFAISCPGVEANWVIDGFQIGCPAGSALLADWGTTLLLGNINWATCAFNMVQAQYHSRVEFARGATQNIVGSCAGAFASANGESIILAQGAGGGQFCTISIGPGVSVGVGQGANQMSLIDLTQATFSGNTITGTSFSANYSYVVNGNIFPATIAGQFAGFRIVPATAINYYVATTGSDNNAGTSTAPFLTIQKAINVVLTQLDTFNQTATINVANGTYTQQALIAATPVGGGIISLVGNIANPSACVLSATGDVVSVSNGATCFIGGFLVTGTINGLHAFYNSNIFVTAPMVFGTCVNAHMRAEYGSNISVQANYTITGNAQAHYLGIAQGRVQAANLAVTLTGTPAFSSAFAQAADMGLIESGGTTFSGSATGQRYNVSFNALIQTNSGASATFYPGSSGGATGTGGIYD